MSTIGTILFGFAAAAGTAAIVKEVQKHMKNPSTKIYNPKKDDDLLTVDLNANPRTGIYEMRH